MVGYGHVAPCAGRCAGSRRPDHARRPCFVRSRRHAHMNPRRATHLSAGPLWRAHHEHSHIHLWPRTTSNIRGQEAGQVRGRRRQRIPLTTYGVQAHLARMRLRLEPTAQQAHTASLLPALLPACCHCHALPAMPHPTLLLPVVPGPRPSAALCTGRREIPMLARPAWPPSPALYVCVCWVM